jgi:hypothetical protein
VAQHGVQKALIDREWGQAKLGPAGIKPGGVLDRIDDRLSVTDSGLRPIDLRAPLPLGHTIRKQGEALAVNIPDAVSDLQLREHGGLEGGIPIRMLDHQEHGLNPI